MADENFLEFDISDIDLLKTSSIINDFNDSPLKRKIILEALDHFSSSRSFLSFLSLYFHRVHLKNSLKRADIELQSDSSKPKISSRPKSIVIDGKSIALDTLRDSLVASATGEVAEEGFFKKTGSSIKNFLAKIGSAFKGLFYKPKMALVDPPMSPSNDQLKLAKAIIAAGKKHEVTRMKLTVGEGVAASIGASYVGASIKGHKGNKGTFLIEVEYK